MEEKLFIEDSEGRRFSNTAEMCAFYGIEKSTYLRRLQRGWSQEKALLEPVRTSPLKSPLSEQERQRTYYQRYYAKNKAKENERVRAYRETHKEEIKAQTKEYREKNKERIREYQKAYRNNPRNKAKARMYQEAYREQKRKRGDRVIMKLLEITFDMLIKAFDDFITTEEQELGCLSNKQHSDFIAMRNYIDDVFIEKLNEGKPKSEEEKKQNVSLMYIPCLEDDDEGMETGRKKRSKECEK